MRLRPRCRVRTALIAVALIGGGLGCAIWTAKMIRRNRFYHQQAGFHARIENELIDMAKGYQATSDKWRKLGRTDLAEVYAEESQSWWSRVPEMSRRRRAFERAASHPWEAPPPYPPTTYPPTVDGPPVVPAP
jgi:hypothetical protein